MAEHHNLYGAGGRLQESPSGLHSVSFSPLEPNSWTDLKILRLSGSHTGYNLATETEKCLQEFDVANRVRFLLSIQANHINGQYSYLCSCLTMRPTTTHSLHPLNAD